MKLEEFSLALNALLPDCDPEAASKWAEFANGCVAHEQYVYFIPEEHDAAVEKWLDATFSGLCAVKEEHGSEIAAKVAGLSCQQCALYPGEMLPAATVLKNGGDAKQISAMMASGDLEMNDPFFLDLPDGAALTRQGPEIDIVQSGVPCGQEQLEPGFLLADGTTLLESERDSFGRYRGGTGMGWKYLQTEKLYAPIRDMDGQINAFQEVKSVTTRELEAAFLANQGDAFAIYRPRAAPAPDDYVSLVRLQESGESPLHGNYDLIHIVQLEPWADPHKIMEACRATAAIRPGDVAAFKQAGTVTCWYIDQLAVSKLPGLLQNYLKAAEMGVEQNYNQLDGLVNNESPKPSVLGSLRQCQEAADKAKSKTAPPSPHHDPER